MDSKEQCRACKFWDTEFRISQWGENKCLRHAPKIIESPYKPEWPVTRAKDWCGDFEKCADSEPLELETGTEVATT